MKKTKDTLIIQDLKYSLSDKFPPDEFIDELKIKIESAQKNITACQETIDYWQKLRLKKLTLLN